MPLPNLRTSICDLLGIDYPILQSGMGRVAGPELVAAVSNAGGLGILAGLGQTADQLRSQIRRVRELTERPFGVNLWLHSELRPPTDVAALPAATVRRADHPESVSESASASQRRLRALPRCPI